MTAWIDAIGVLPLTGCVLTFFSAMTLAMTALGFALEHGAPHRRIWSVPLDAGQLRHELIGNLVFVAVTSACFVAVLGAHVVRYAQPTLLNATATFLGFVAGFQVYYYVLHRIMHLRSFVRFHRWHHKSRVTTPLSGQSMSAVEAFGWAVGYAGLPVLFSQWIPISLEGWFAYMIVNVTGNIVGHANVELVPATQRPLLLACFSNTFVYHALHHARWTGHYSFQAAVMDRLFGTEWHDWPALHTRVRRGQPLTSLRDCDARPDTLT